MPICYCTKCTGRFNYTPRTLLNHIKNDRRKLSLSANQREIEFYNNAIQQTTESLNPSAIDESSPQVAHKPSDNIDLLNSVSPQASGSLLPPTLDLETLGPDLLHDSGSPAAFESPIPSEADTWSQGHNSTDSSENETASSVESVESDDKDDQMDVDSSLDSSDSDDSMSADDIPELLKLRNDLLGEYYILNEFNNDKSVLKVITPCQRIHQV
jgi:hypothetical protein